MRTIALLVSYDGTGYNGYQSQPEGNTVQDRLEHAISILLGNLIKVHGSGRTDAGVHAMGQVVSFRTDSRIPIERWALALNARLPDDIVVRAAVEAPEAFHARRSAVRKTYRYMIDSSQFPDVFDRKYAFHHPGRLRFESMRQALVHLLGEHDFTSFTSPNSTKPSHIRTIYEAKLLNLPGGDGFEEEGRGKSCLYLTGNGFLYNMVRIIAGTLLQIGEGKRQPEDMARILAACDRSKAGPTAMPHGLTLMSVEYGPEWGIDWQAAIHRRR